MHAWKTVTDARTLSLIGGVLVLLGAASAIVQVLRSGADERPRPGDPRDVPPPRPRLVDSAVSLLAAAFLHRPRRPRSCCSA